MVYSVHKMVVNKTIDRMVVDKEVDNRAVKQGVFKQVLLAKKSVIGFNKLLLLKTLITSNNIINYIRHLVKYLSCRVFG